MIKITKYSCPYCFRVYKQKRRDEDDLITLSWRVSIPVIKKFFKISKIPKLGNPIIMCNNCKKFFLSDEYQEWSMLDIYAKKIWSYRNKIVFLYVISGIIPLCMFFAFVLLFSKPILSIVLSIIVVILVSIIIVFKCLFNKYNNSTEIIISNSDLEKIKKSLERTGDELDWEEPPLRVKKGNIMYGIYDKGKKKSSKVYKW